jgi:protein-L-isoaspartate(D-aspartate) O-methyltransferase
MGDRRRLSLRIEELVGVAALGLSLVVLLMGAAAVAEDNRTAERRQMVDDIVALSRQGLGDPGRAIGARVLAAMGKVARHEFVPALQKRSAYRNRPLPIGSGQTISQPYIVALMTDLLDLEPGDSVLEIGTGCGYQSAVLAELAREVYTIEIVESLGRTAAAALLRLGYANVHPKVGDGYKGWPEHAPFDAIIVTAAPDHVPPVLVEQLKPGGHLVIPVGRLAQQLIVITKHSDGSTAQREVAPVQFVPLTRGGRKE